MAKHWSRPDLPRAHPPARRAARAAADAAAERLAVAHTPSPSSIEGARVGGDDRQSRRPTGRAPSPPRSIPARAERHRDAGPHLPADGARRRRAGAHRPYRGGGRHCAPRRPQPVGRDLRDHERRRPMARREDLVRFAQFHGLKIATIADLIAYRRRHDRIVERKLESRLREQVRGHFHMYIYVNTVRHVEHIAAGQGRHLDARTGARAHACAQRPRRRARLERERPRRLCCRARCR